MTRDERIRERILHPGRLLELVEDQGPSALIESALSLAQEGLTSHDEVIRATRD